MRGFTTLNNNLSLVYQRLGYNTKVENLHFYRILLGLYYLIEAKDFSFLAHMPSSLFRPHVLNFTNFFDTWPTTDFFRTLYTLKLFLALMLVFGVKSRISFLIIGAITLIHSGFLYSFGKIDHAILLNLLPFCMAFTNSGCKMALFPDKCLINKDLALSIFGIFISFGFFTAGFEKAFIWIDFNTSTSGFLSWFYPSYYSINWNQLLAPLILNFPWWLLEMFDYAAVLFELSGILFLFYSRKSWLYYLLFGCIFHLFSTLFLNIPFQAHILVIGVWFITPFLKRFKFLIIAFPLVFCLDHINAFLLGWISVTIVAMIFVKNEIWEEKLLLPYS